LRLSAMINSLQILSSYPRPDINLIVDIWPQVATAS
jgi:hypothetical protein